MTRDKAQVSLSGRCWKRCSLLALVVVALVAAGCQAQTAGPAADDSAAVTQAAVTPATVEPQASAAVPVTDEAATATPEPKIVATPLDSAAEEVAMSEEAAPVETETVSEESAAANADVEFVRAVRNAGGSWQFQVTVRHPDSGWEDYADGWDVMTPDGQVLKASEDDTFTRLLLHPHENEQPFTRSQSGIVVPEGVTVVIVRAHDLVDGFGGREVRVDLASDGGADFEVVRE